MKNSKSTPAPLSPSKSAANFWNSPIHCDQDTTSLDALHKLWTAAEAGTVTTTAPAIVQPRAKATHPLDEEEFDIENIPPVNHDEFLKLNSMLGDL